MNSVPLPPPPPPPSSSQLKIKQPAVVIRKTEKEKLDFALGRLLTLDEKFGNIFYKINTYLKSQLQNGPQCGLVALSIASSMNKNSVSVETLLKEAVSQNFTKQGEIFDVNFLSFLAEKCCGFKAHIIEGGLSLHLYCIINSLLKKNLLLVPYDADFNHSPCCKKGCKAHWAVITGFVIVQPCVNHETEHRCPEVEKDNSTVFIGSQNPSLCSCVQNESNDLSLIKSNGKLFIKKKSSQSSKCDANSREGKIYLIGLQGKSKHIGLWPFDDMAESNDNLLYFSTSRDSECYIIPIGGPAAGLKGKAIILRNLLNLSAADILPVSVNI